IRVTGDGTVTTGEYQPRYIPALDLMLVSGNRKVISIKACNLKPCSRPIGQWFRCRAHKTELKMIYLDRLSCKWPMNFRLILCYPFTAMQAMVWLTMSCNFSQVRQTVIPTPTPPQPPDRMKAGTS